MVDVSFKGWVALVCLSRSPSSALLPFLGEGSRTKTDYRKTGTLILTSLLEDLAFKHQPQSGPLFCLAGGLGASASL